jgi:competence protein ComEC
MQWTSAPNIEGAPLPQRARGYWRALFSDGRERIESFLEAERAQLPLWAVVGFGTGIAAWFWLASRPGWIGLIALCAGIALVALARPGGRLERATGIFALMVALGCAFVWTRATYVAAPRLDWPVIASFEAKVERVEQLVARGDLRLTLAPSDPELPPRVRVSLNAETAPEGIARGGTVRLRARLTGPPQMALPGGYDFARDAWFRGIGGVGRALGPIELLDPTDPGGLDLLRERLGRQVRDRLDGPSGTIATALATGDKSAVEKADAEAMRRSGLAHLLAVSGLHIGAIVGAAMLLTLKLLALSQRLALRTNLILVAAGAGALAGIGYTLLTGMQVPTVRACIAALLVLGGIALGRDAISLRLIAVGALLVMLVRPEFITGASFQFSFAAVTAIVALHTTPWARRMFHRRGERFPAAFGRGMLALFATGVAVEIALTPFALYHFNKAGLYSVAANLIAIPLTTFVIMPSLVGALFLDLLGLGAPLWWLTGLALDSLLWVAHQVSRAPGSVAMLPTMPVWALFSMALGGLWICLWTRKARLLGLVPFAIGAAAAASTPVPDLLVTGDGRHLAVITSDGTPNILRNRTGSFMREIFAENAGYDGAPELLEDASFASCSSDACVARVAGEGRSWQVLATRSSLWLEYPDLVRACGEADIAISERWLPRGCRPRWLKLDRGSLDETGGIAIYLDREPRVVTVAGQIGDHPWWK